MLPQSEAGIDEALRQQLRHKLEGVHEEEVLQIRESHGSSSVSAQIALFSRSESWLFGDVWSPVPTDEHRAPLSLLFVAQRDAGQWQYATETDDAFVPLINCLPNSLLAPAAKRFFSEDRAFSVDTDLGLPWLRASRGKLTGGPHGNSGGRPYSALDFKPPQGIIRAPAGGVVTFGCSRVRIRIDHGNGYSTHYYHIDKATAVASGTIITEGDYLGKMSARIDCGGRATGPHVHLALKRKGRFIAVEGRTLGGWTFYEGDHAYGGRAVEGSTGKLCALAVFL